MYKFIWNEVRYSKAPFHSPLHTVCFLKLFCSKFSLQKIVPHQLCEVTWEWRGREMGWKEGLGRGWDQKTEVKVL